MAEIRVVGLGPGSKEQLPLGVYQHLKETERLYVRTKEHPVLAQLEAEGFIFHAFDSVYAAHDQFETVYQEIVKQLLAAARQHGQITYAVPGHPLVAERTVQRLLEGGHGVKISIEGGQSFLDPLFSSLRIDPNEGFLLLDGTGLHPSQLNPRLHTIISQVYDRMVASEVKLTLMELYPDQYPVTLVRGAGLSDGEQLTQIPLYELDRVIQQDNMTAVYLPPTEEEAVLNRTYAQVREIFRTLRGPDGCPWDKSQTHQSLKNYVLEEAQEVCQAIDSGDVENLIEELGDLLLQVFLHAQIAEDDGVFTMEDVLAALSEKMIRRHPHVFGDKKLKDAASVKAEWEKIKAEEYREKQNRQQRE